MTGALDSTFGPLAKNLISKFGKAATLTRTTKTVNVATGRATGTPVAYGVVVTPPAPVRQYWINGTTVKTGDVFAGMAREGASVVPLQGDQLRLDGFLYTVTEVLPVYSGELVAMYNLILRR